MNIWIEDGLLICRSTGIGMIDLAASYATVAMPGSVNWELLNYGLDDIYRAWNCTVKNANYPGLET